MVPAARSAEDLYARALTTTNAGRFPAARRQLDRARAAATDPDLRARVDLTTAYVESETESPARGLELALDVLGRPDLGRETYGRTWSQLGLLHMRTGRAEDALHAFAEAVARLDRHPEPLARVLLNRGNVFLQQGDPSRAAADFTEAAERFGEAGILVERAKSRFNLGYAELLRGDLVAALRGMDDARDVLAPLSPAYRATVEQDRAEVLVAAGMSREAARALEEAATAYGARRLRRFQADCELALAQTLLRGDPARARVVARRAARRFRALDGELPALRADGVAAVAEVAAGGRTPALLRRLDELATALHGREAPRDALPLRLQAVRLLVERGDLDGATRRTAEIRVRGSDPLAVRLHWREVRAELAEARRRPALARRHVRSGLADLHAWQSSFGSLDLQSTLVGHGRDLAQLGLRSALADGRPELVLEWSERARALVGRVAPVRPPPDEQLAADLTALRVLHGAAPAPRSIEARRRDELAASIRQRSWYGGGGGLVGEPASLPEVRDELRAGDAALVAHVWADGALAALVVTPEGASVHPLGPSSDVRRLLDSVAADLDMAASDLAGPFAAAIRGSLDERLARVGDLLLGPVLPLLGDRRLVLTPSGLLAGTPWSLLPGLAGRPLTIPQSATRWLELRRTPPAAGGRVGLVAGPHVPRGEEEVTRAGAQWRGAEVLCGAEATAARVSDLASRVDVLHLAGHGRHPGDNPLFSAVELADGPWFGYDIDQLATTPATVVLSACELGRVAVRSGEEAVGMSAAWLHAGARTVVSSPALVADDVACEVLAGWHHRVSRGEAAADALAAASDAVGGAEAAPSPFLCFGVGW
jgi:tetratricopeptide (TPR) repeat protein